MRIVITGADGQLGRDLQRALAGHVVRPLSHRDLDVSNAAAVNESLASIRPDTVIHAAALTDTGRCERAPGAAHAANAVGSEHVATGCAHTGAQMVYVSTNEVFDGKKASPYLEDDRPAPVNHYGRSKLAGEHAVQAILGEHYIVRTAWLFGHGGENFIAKMMRAAEAGEVTGVTDEVATPTWTRDLAAAIASLIELKRYGTYHFTNAGEASRHDWLCEILRLAGKPGVRVRPISTAEFRASLPADAVVPRKPPYSALANMNGAALGITLRPWREALAAYFASSP